MIIEIKETKQVIGVVLDNNNAIYFDIKEPIVDVDLFKQEIKDWLC